MDKNVKHYDWHCTGCDCQEIIAVDANELTFQELIDKANADHIALRKAKGYVDGTCMIKELMINLEGMEF